MRYSNKKTITFKLFPFIKNRRHNHDSMAATESQLQFLTSNYVVHKFASATLLTSCHPITINAIKMPSSEPSQHYICSSFELFR